jgi:hypothetical protein
VELMQRTLAEQSKTLRDLETRIALKVPFGSAAEAILYRMETQFTQDQPEK